jgi:hypothetical protein
MAEASKGRFGLKILEKNFSLLNVRQFCRDYLVFQKGMVPSFKKRALASKKRAPRPAAVMFS